MKRVILTIVAAVGLAACAGRPRTEPPAPIETSSARVTAPVQSQPSVQKPPPPQESAVELYPYRAPGSSPEDVPLAESAVRQEESPAPSMTSLPSERATGTSVQAETATLPASGVSAIRQPVLAYAPPALAAPTLPPAADALARQAEQQRQSRDYVGAAATLERALRIQPREAYLWNRLARVRMEQGSHSQAGSLAARSNTLAGEEAALKQDNWSMIAISRRAGGDAEGALEAEQKARGG